MEAIRIEQITTAVAGYYKISVCDMCSATRRRAIVMPRQVAHFMARELTRKTTTEIGRKIGHKDHTSVIHSVKVVKNLCSIYDEFAVEVDSIKKIILSQPKKNAPVLSMGVAYSFYPQNNLAV